jgi:hypothetical protein
MAESSASKRFKSSQKAGRGARVSATPASFFINLALKAIISPRFPKPNEPFILRWGNMNHFRIRPLDTSKSERNSRCLRNHFWLFSPPLPSSLQSLPLRVTVGTAMTAANGVKTAAMIAGTIAVKHAVIACTTTMAAITNRAA